MNKVTKKLYNKSEAFKKNTTLTDRRYVVDVNNDIISVTDHDKILMTIGNTHPLVVAELLDTLLNTLSIKDTVEI